MQELYIENYKTFVVVSKFSKTYIKGEAGM